MRKLLMFSFFSALISVISCVDEVDGLSGFVDGDVRFEASFSAVSKAVLEPGADGSKVAWESGDKVGILVGGGSYLYTASTAGYSTTLLTESADVPSDGTYYAVFPYDSDATLSDGVVTTVLPSEQKAVLGSFTTHLAVAQTNDTKLAFRNVCGLVKVTVDADNVTKIVFEGNNGETVAGGINVTVDDAPSWTPVAGHAAASVTLVPASGTLAKGSYYFAVLPQTFTEGFNVKAYKGEDAYVLRNVAAEFTLERSDIVGSKAFGIEGAGTEASPYILKTPQDLVDMPSLAKLGGETWFRMANDIDMSSVKNYVPVNYDQNYERKIHFDGAGKTISNLTCSGGTYTSFFGVLYGSCRNLYIKNAVIKDAGSGAGILAGFAGTDGKPATVTDVHVQGTLRTSRDRVGGMAGVAKNATFADCSSDVTITSSSTDAGGFIGRTQGECHFLRCTSKASVSSSASQKNRIGGFIGWNSSAVTECTDCHVLEGTVLTDLSGRTSESNGNYGGFIGFGDATGTITTISKCSASADIKAGISNYNSTFIGGTGYASETTVKDCWASGSVKGSSYVAGLIGGSKSVFTVSRCWSSSTVEAVGQKVGGLVGNNRNVLTLEDCYSTGDVSSDGQMVAGIIGYTDYPVEVSRCYSTGNITSGAGGAAGIVGVVSTTGASVTRCIAWNADVTSRRDYADMWAPGAVIGAADMGTYAGCYRRSDLKLVDNAGAMTLVDHEDITNAIPPAPSYSTDVTQTAYHGRATTAVTLSAAAESIGWSEKVWDFSGDFPQLRKDVVDEDVDDDDQTQGVYEASVVYPVSGGSKVKTLLTNDFFTVQRTVCEGITYYNAEQMYDVVSGAVQTVNVLEVDLDNPSYRVRFHMTDRATVSQTGKSTNSIACVNAAYEQDAIYNRTDGYNHSEVTLDSGHLRFWKHEGAVVGDGQRKIGLIHGAKGHSTATWSGIASGGTQAIAVYKQLTEDNIFASAPMLIDDYDRVGSRFVPEPYRSMAESDIKNQIGNSEDYRQHQGVRHPRTAVALTADNDLLLITVDGRFSGRASGMSAIELTEFIHRHFAPRWALNMDGGGSTTMYVAGSEAAGYGRADDVVNHPCNSGSTWTSTVERSLNTFFLIQKN